MEMAEMKGAEAPAPPGGQSTGQPQPSVSEVLSAACVAATERAMTHMRQTMAAQGHTPSGVPPSTETNS